MRLNDIGLEEVDLIDLPSGNSIDPKPARQGINKRILKDLVQDHLHGLRTINADLDAPPELDKVLKTLESHYEKLFGMRLTELDKAAR